MERRQSGLIFVDEVKQVGFEVSLNMAREGEYLTESWRVFQVSAEAQLKERRQ